MTPIGWLFVGGIAFLYLFAFRWMWLDRYRVKLFGYRDTLFALGASGAVPFDHPAYRILRDHINDCIRFAHRVGAVELLACAPLIKSKSEPSWYEIWTETLTDLPEEAASDLKTIQKMVGLALLEHLFASTPLLRTLVVFLLILGLSSAMTSQLARFASFGRTAETRMFRLGQMLPSPRMV